MDIYQLRYFLTIAETGTFSSAAERLYLSQPSLSTGIKKLEQELGVSLFERGGRRTVLTAAGRAFQEKANVIMEQYQSALLELQGFSDQPTLRVGVISTMHVRELANMIGTFQNHYPNVATELHDGTTQELRDSLEAGTIDASISVLNSSAQKDNKSSVTLFQQPLQLAVSKTHPFAQRASIRLADLDGQPFIDRINCEFFERECQILKTSNIQPKVVYRASHEEWVISLIRAGLGITIMPRWQGLADIVYIPIADLDFQRTIGIRWRQQDSSELLETFCRFATSHNWESVQNA